MSDNKNNVTKTPNGNIVEGTIEKKGFFQKIKEKKDAFAEKHPVACRRIGTVTKVTIGAAAGFLAGAALGSRSKDNAGIEMIDMDSVDVETVDLDDNDNN